jgi:hypothetical protein
MLVTLAVVAAAVVLAIDLLDKRPLRFSSNGRGLSTAGELAPRKGRLCQRDELVPVGTGGVSIYASSQGETGGPLDVSVLDGTRVIARGRLDAGNYPVGPSYVRLDRGVPTGKRTICIDNRGPNVVLIYGDESGGAEAAEVTGMKQFKPVRLRFDFLTGRERTALGWSPTVAERAGLVKASFIGSWTMWAALALLLLSCAGAVVAAWRAVRA